MVVLVFTLLFFYPSFVRVGGGVKHFHFEQVGICTRSDIAGVLPTLNSLILECVSSSDKISFLYAVWASLSIVSLLFFVRVV